MQRILRAAVIHRQTIFDELPPASIACNGMVQSFICETPFFCNYGHHSVKHADLTASITNHGHHMETPSAFQNRQTLSWRQKIVSIRATVDKQMYILASAPLHTQDTEIGLDALV